MGAQAQASLGSDSTAASTSAGQTQWNYFGNQPLGYSSMSNALAPQTTQAPPTAAQLNGTMSPNQVTPQQPVATPQGAAPAPAPAPASAAPAQSGPVIGATPGQPTAIQPSGSPVIGSWGQNFLNAGGTVPSAGA